MVKNLLKSPFLGCGKRSWVLLLLGGGIFSFFGWLVSVASSPALPSPTQPLLFYSNQTQQDLKLTLCQAIKNCQSSLKIQVYSITDAKIISLLKEKIDAGLTASILYDQSATGNLTKTLPTALPAQSKGLMHRKIITLDDKWVFLGTANLTPQSLQMHDNLLLGFYHPELAHFLKDPQEYFSFTIDRHPAELWMLPSKNALNRLIQLIDNAKKTVYVAMFTLTHPTLVECLKKAEKRGVDVRLAIDFHTGHGASLKAVTSLQTSQVPIFLSRGQQLLHHKWAIIDNQTLVVGSANWTKAAFEKNQDCFLVLHSLKKTQKRFLKKLWKTIERESAPLIS